MPSTEIGSGRRGQQQIVEVVAEDADGLGVGAPLQFQANFALNRGIQEALPGVIYGQLQLRSPISSLVAGLAQNVPLHQGDGPLRGDFDQEVEHILALAAPNRQHSMRGNRLHRSEYRSTS